MPYFYTFVLFLMPFFGVAQQVGSVDFDAIKQESLNPTSEWYYPKLKERLLKGDSTLTKEDYRHLYYGSVFQPSYAPYGLSPVNKDFFDGIEAEEKNTVLLEKGLLALADNPANLSVVLRLILIANSIGTNPKHCGLPKFTRHF